MSISLSRSKDMTRDEVAELVRALADYYKNPPPSYYQIADQGGQNYAPATHPFHLDLASRVTKNASLLDMGCGTARLCAHVGAHGGTYTGLDYSETLLERNRKEYPNARFFSVGTPLQDSFDIVASLYTIEHVVDPPAYLELMWSYCKPGGLLAIICPEFVDGRSFPPSLFFGMTPRRFREKLRTFSLADAFRHLLDLKWVAPRWKQLAQNSPAGAFWINRKPGILHGAPYSIDADAIHFPRLKDLVWHFEQKGAQIIQSSAGMQGIEPAVLQHNCYVLARKPGAPQALS